MEITGGGFETAWRGAGTAVRRSLELAYLSLVGGGLAVGAVLVDGEGRVRAEGRNRAYDRPPASGRGDPQGGSGVLQGTPLAHAELNALAAARTGWKLGGLTLWSTQQPCSMCAAAAEFTGVGAVRYLAPDPWALATGREAGRSAARVEGPAADAWLIAANLLFLQGLADSGGPDQPTLRRNRELEPETVELVGVHDPAGEVAAFLAPRWERIEAAAAARRARCRTEG